MPMIYGLFLTSTALAAPEVIQTDPSEALFIAQIVLLLLAGRLLGEVMQRIGQPAVMGQLIAGVVLGPSVFGAIWPEAQHAISAAGREQKAMLEAVSDLGILMLLLLTGMETDLKLVKRAQRAAVSVSAAGIVVPFVCGFVLGQFLPEAMLPKPDQRLTTSLFLGTALSIASVKIVAMVVREKDWHDARRLRHNRRHGRVDPHSDHFRLGIAWRAECVKLGAKPARYRTVPPSELHARPAPRVRIDPLDERQIHQRGTGRNCNF